MSYPNPFTTDTKIVYTLSRASKVELTIYSITGEEIVTLLNEEQNSGFHIVAWNGLDKRGHTAPAGIYVYKLYTESTNTFEVGTILRCD